MYHLVFERPASTLKVFSPSGLVLTCEASGDAWGNYENGVRRVQYGRNGSISPGHYLLTHVEAINPPIASEGAYQIYVSDVDQTALQRLVAAGKAAYASSIIDIGGVDGQIGGLEKYGRSEVMLHGGGSNLGEPECFASRQPLLRTFGCTRLHNEDLEHLAHIVSAALAEGNKVVFSVIGDSPALPD